MRVTTAFNNLLGLPGASVIDVAFSAEAVVVTVRLRRRRRVCAGCGQVADAQETAPGRQTLLPLTETTQS